ncbi:nitroreductase/quinone reductase family protein [Nocardia cyriacigeorgica]|uniref:Nitroreductase family deazaflavin-dependent oxidoreductase n=1 Tax=Nocardia cyriacigeorgica TaxID=135487 RepID=A0A5R8NSP3_9NOCA|nr:nitroreductase/quinone reductase family protein [Nocardia cyriacigeorgica]TLF78710.1 nitroreductase family deazaflavin-dependent oxidoreductase [Nocardia cyriacigeorgica]
MDLARINQETIAKFRAGEDPDGMRRDRLLLLTTTGRRSGRPHTSPMMFHRDGDRLLVIASNMGASRHPDWYSNLVQRPNVVVEVGEETYDAHATPLEGEERERIWAMLKQTYPWFADHEKKTQRIIPVVALTRADPAVPGE